jgi:hypothetical protein
MFLFLVFNSLYSMERPAIVIEITDHTSMDHTSMDIDLLRYYHHDTKELNLSNIQIGDANLAVIESQLKTFIESVGVERLIIENADLKTVPFNLIGFTLISKTLKYVSFLGNKFATTGMLSTSMLDVSGGAGGEDVRPRADTRVDSLVASTVSSLWGNLSPEIERILKEHNSNGSKFHYYNKIIFIDRTMPPVTILDAKRAPYTKYERIKYIMIRVGLFGLGVMVTFVPSIVPWLLETSKESD